MKEKPKDNKEIPGLGAFISVDKEGRVTRKGIVYKGSFREFLDKLKQLRKKYGDKKPLKEIIDEIFGIGKESKN